MSDQKPGWNDEETTIYSFSEPLVVAASSAVEPSPGRAQPAAEDSSPAAGAAGAASGSDVPMTDPDATVYEKPSMTNPDVERYAATTDPNATVYEHSMPSRQDRTEEKTQVEGAEGPPNRVSEGDIAWLVLTKTRSVRRGAMFNLNKPRIEIGSGIVDISVSDPKVSRVHAAVRYERSGGGLAFVLHDMASTNGTFVNGQLVSAPVALKDGDTLRIGETEFVFKRV